MNTTSNGLRAGTGSLGLIAGLLYGWTVSVIPGLRRISDEAYIDTMQSINRAIINPAFVVPFVGLPVGLTASSVGRFRDGEARRGLLMAGAAATYAIGVLGVTVARNVPLNNTLEAFETGRVGPAAIAARRQSYESSWNRWHYVRTIASVGAFALSVFAAAGDAD